MNGTPADSGKAGREAKNDVVSRAGRASDAAERRYEALLRYMRGLYSRSSKESTRRKDT
ncbi:hypothetical protein KDK95_04785 [Actinospica sp. MGRD01-02]|uniref:Uncharacterized protein n=1 Tax=Actinospica acidithermotolerans TaxID=2828514 RepID=A0A941IHD8_9ACTN|nr:hypothetical protein [Actinospica acidithermotolerans]MBR7825612.1 hypothetical protein [Actinospica acidithermotolerans]